MGSIKRYAAVYLSLLLVGVIANAADDKDAACDDKHATVCIEQGEALLKKNQIEAGKALLVKACDYKEARGCLKAGIVAERTGNFSEAKSFYQKTCELKDEKPCKNVALVEKKMKK